MKKIALLALLISTAAYAEEGAGGGAAGGAGSPQVPVPNMASRPPMPTPPPVAGPPAPPPAGETTNIPAPPPSVWMIQDLDSGDLNTINQCVMELPKRVADQFISRLSSKIKVVK